MAGFDPYDKGQPGIDWDELLRTALVVLQILTGIFGVVILVAAFVLALRVFNFVGGFVEDPDRIAAYIDVLKQGETLLPPAEEAPEAPAPAN